MSGLAQPNGDDYPEAASKHLEDASRLLDARRYDGAAYHAGYVVECALKTIVQLEGGRPYGHLNVIGPNALQLASLPGARTARYAGQGVPAPAILHPTSGWQLGMRYWQEGRVPEATARAWQAEALIVYGQTVPRMRLDGVI